MPNALAVLAAVLSAVLSKLGLCPRSELQEEAHLHALARATVRDLARDLEAARAEFKELEAKYELEVAKTGNAISQSDYEMLARRSAFLRAENEAQRQALSQYQTALTAARGNS